MIDLWMNGFTSFSVKPLRIMMYLGIIFALIGFCSGVVVIVKRLLGLVAIAGYSSLMAVMLFMFGVLIFFMGLIGEYVGRIYISLNNSPQYVIKEHVESKFAKEE